MQSFKKYISIKRHSIPFACGSLAETCYLGINAFNLFYFDTCQDAPQINFAYCCLQVTPPTSALATREQAQRYHVEGERRACPALKCMHRDHPPPATPQVGATVHSGKSTGWRTTSLDPPQSHCKLDSAFWSYYLPKRVCD